MSEKTITGFDVTFAWWGIADVLIWGILVILDC